MKSREREGMIIVQEEEGFSHLRIIEVMDGRCSHDSLLCYILWWWTDGHEYWKMWRQ